jgi:hypothetical protein
MVQGIESERKFPHYLKPAKG